MIFGSHFFLLPADTSTPWVRTLQGW